MDVEKDTILIKKREKKAKKKKKKKTDNMAIPNLVEDDQSNKLEKKRKKEKKKTENNSEESRKRENGSVCIDMDVDKDPARVPNIGEDGNHYDKAMKKMKKDKRKSQVDSETSKANVADMDVNHEKEVDNNYENEKVEKKKKKDKGKSKDLVKADDNYHSEKHKKKRRRKLEQSNVEIFGVEKENQKDRKKKKKRTKDEERKSEDDKNREGFDIVIEHEISRKLNKEKSENKNKKKKLARSGDDMKMQDLDTNVSEKVKKKRKREEDLKDGDKPSNENETISAIENNSEDPKLKKKKKKVTFSDQNEVFLLEGKIVQGKRFTPEEDEKVKKAVFDYIKAHDLGDEGLEMVLNCKSHPQIRDCWREIGEALPYRPYKSVYSRAHTLFERGETGSWNDEDLEILRKYHVEHGPKWKQMAVAMGKHRRHVKDAWRRHKNKNRNRGHWSQEEYQNLFNLVNVDLRAKVNEEKKSKHGMLRDNISWGAISDTLNTRNFATCCFKWYNQLTSSMVQEGEWADTDDYRLIDALYAIDACCIEDVDWDNLLEHRSGEICRKRWKQMSNHIGEYGKKSFAEQVEILSKRYCPELAEVRESWDNKKPCDEP